MSGLLKRTTLLVSDAERALAFYRDGVGFAVWYDAPVPVAQGMLPLDAPEGAETRLVIMRGPDPKLGMIGLLQVTHPCQPVRPRLGSGIGVGDIVLVMETQDARGLAKRVRAAGGSIFAEPYEWTVPSQADRTPKSLITTSFFDLDGYFWEASQGKP